jgi:hypothetical protein
MKYCDFMPQNYGIVRTNAQILEIHTSSVWYAEGNGRVL